MIAGLIVALAADGVRADGGATSPASGAAPYVPYALQWALGAGYDFTADEPGGTWGADGGAVALTGAQWRLRFDGAARPATDDESDGVVYEGSGRGEREFINALRFRDSEPEIQIIDPSRTHSAHGDALRWELAPSVYFSGGRLLPDEDGELEYSDVYAGLSIDVADNAGFSVGYQHLRQALSGVREGETLDPEALFLRFELRF